MTIFKANLLKISLASVLMICVVILIPIRINSINRIILSPFEKKFSKKLGFKTSKIWIPGNIFLQGLSISEGNKIMVSAEELNIDYNMAFVLLREGGVSFKASGLAFQQNINLLASVSAMLTIPKMPHVSFQRIEGKLNFRKDAIYIKEITAVTNDMRVSAEGRVGRHGDLNCKLHFSFSDSVLKDAPDIIKTSLLNEEADGWMGITLNANGNYAKPSLSIDSETFKLNIKEGALKLR